MNFKDWTNILTACVPILVALVGIIPTVINNRKKTQESLQAMQEQITNDIKATKKEVAELSERLNTHEEEYEAHQAKQCRYRILRFYDEICRGDKHSESHFEDILDDIDFYEVFCEKHKDFKNNRGRVAMRYINETYNKVKAHGGFLTHSD